MLPSFNVYQGSGSPQSFSQTPRGGVANKGRKRAVGPRDIPSHRASLKGHLLSRWRRGGVTQQTWSPVRHAGAPERWERRGDTALTFSGACRERRRGNQPPHPKHQGWQLMEQGCFV
ncbi:hypothetical protein AAFF_G00404600 [Aldrovandia affinis]|uniref:Uncharacterized protein n=1 Tax=Aldrovandia affinis TaxID=143900 RepID=A0AAD7X0P4_9TELE|nr:hypothetical protein AAFF_G00404600 [Aldrovandia affinis]